MYKRHTGQISMLEAPEMFGSLPLNPDNDWIKLSKFVPWREFDLKYADNFRSKKGQRACDSRMALGSVLIKIHYKGMSDENLTEEIAMNPYLQYFLGLQEYRYECPFDASMMTRFRQRISAEMLAWVNDEIIGRRAAAEKKEEDHRDDDSDGAGSSGQDENNGGESEEGNQGTLILDATCAPQNIRFPTDASLLNEARQKSEEIIDILHENGLTDGKRPRTHREIAQWKHNSYSKARKKTAKMIRTEIRQQLGYLRRNLNAIDSIEEKHPGCLVKVLPARKHEMLQVIRILYSQQEYMYRTRTHKVPDRIVSISQHWVRPIVRGKQNADVEFGAKVEMSIVDGFLRIEDLRWDPYNESTTFQQSVKSYKQSYGHYPKRVLADKIFRTRENIQYCKQRGIHLNGPKLGKPYADPVIQKEQKKLEWQESGERGEIERNFGVGKRRYGLDCIVTKLKETSEVMIHASVLYMNLRKKLRLLLRSFFSRLWKSLQGLLEDPTFALA